MDQKGRPEHEDIIRLSDFLVIWEIHDEATHRRVALVRGHPSQDVIIGQQLVAQMGGIKE